MPKKSSIQENVNKGGEGPIETVYCPCGEIMVVVPCKNLYESWMPVFCNECWARQDKDIYHCPTGRNFSHVLGYDICWACSEKYKKNPNENKHENDSEDLEAKQEEIVDIIPNSEGVDKISSSNTFIWTKVNELNRLCTLQSATITDLQKKLEKFNLSLPHNNDKKIDEQEQPNKENEENQNNDEEEQEESEEPEKSEEHEKKKEDTSLTIHELYELKNRLQILSDFEKNVGILLQNLVSNSVDNIITHRLQNWQNWDTNEIIEWILSLDNTKYRRYEKIMNEKMYLANIKGKHLPNIDKMDLYRFGIEDYQDEIDILGYISNLIYSYPSQEMLKIEEKETEGNPGEEE